MRALYPILEFDPSPNAIIEPHLIHDKIDIPEHCVVCFFADVFDSLKDSGKLKVVATQRSEIGDNHIYELALDGKRLTAFHPGVGAPLAAAFWMK